MKRTVAFKYPSEATREEAEAYIRCRNRQHPSDELYEHWYVAIRH